MVEEKKDPSDKPAVLGLNFQSTARPIYQGGSCPRCGGKLSLTTLTSTKRLQCPARHLWEFG